MINQAQAVQIARHLARTLRDVAFYHAPAGSKPDALVFCEVIEKAKESDWDFADKQKLDAEIYLYALHPEAEGVFHIHARQYTPKKKGSRYRVVEVKNRVTEGFGFVCACEEIIDG